MAAPQLYMAPPGTSPTDSDAWTPLGTIDSLLLDLTPARPAVHGDHPDWNPAWTA
ncbi:hypothetical protein GCM10017673_39070 [Streptosporangium violaceochromogenes]|nr:hypothetical protein GCM10017673_39070 [Streptosporangium violaceochromogenes]